METPTPSRLTFMGLPPELRLHIYRLLLAPSVTCICNRVCTAILRTNSQVFKEAESILYKNWTPRLLLGGGFPTHRISMLLLARDMQHSVTAVIFPSRWVNGVEDIERNSSKASLKRHAVNCHEVIRYHLPGTNTVSVHVDYFNHEPMIDIEMLVYFIGRFKFANCIVELHQPAERLLHGEFQRWVSELRLKIETTDTLDADFKYNITVDVLEFA